MKPVNVIKIEKIQTKSKIDTCRILVDKKEFQDRLIDELAAARGGRRESWAGRNALIFNRSALANSGKGSGTYKILDCTCGSGAECTGVYSEIEVVHDNKNNTIQWTCGVPEVWINGDEKFFTLTFHKPQYIKELGKL